MSDTNKTPRNISSAPHFAFGLTSRSMRRRTGALMMGTALGAIVGLGYGRGVYAQTTLSGANTTTQTLTGPGEFVTVEGFSVDTSGGSGDGITISTTGDDDTTFTDGFASSITGNSSGISAYNNGSGTLSISTTGPVTGNFGNGVYAGTNRGSIEISSDGDVSASGGPNSGIYAYVKSSEGGSLSISGSGDISGNFDAIGAFNYGAGHTDINVSGSLISTGHGGLWAINKGTYLSISTGYVSAAGMGILAQNQGSGVLDITANGDVFGLGSGRDNYDNVYAGINAQNSGTDLTISANNVTGDAFGIYADNDGTGELRITTTGSVIGQSLHGIFTRNVGTDLTVNAATVAGSVFGVHAVNNGSGALSITTSGAVTSQFLHGIYALNFGTELTINAASVAGGERGIKAFNYGSGALAITANGEVSGQRYGIWALNNGTDLSVNAVTATGGVFGIYAQNAGTGALNITTTGDVSGQSNVGIRARNDPLGTDLSINAASTSGEVGGIRATNSGIGALNITMSGDVTGESVYGIYARNRGTDLTVNAARVTGGVFGIHAFNFGGGDLQIGASGDVIGQNVFGIYARNLGGDLNLNTASVAGGHSAIIAYNNGSGTLSITTTGQVTGGTNDGIYAYNASSEDTTITINAGGSVSTSGTDADDWAIEANAPNGAIIVNNFGTVTGRVNLSNSNTFTNSGTWDLAGTTSDFNATGNSLVVNQGLIIAASDSATEEWPWLDNLDVFRNEAGGTIRLTDGATGDVFRIGNSQPQPQATADFVANGGTIELDVVLGGDGSASDRLDISGDVILDSAPTALAFTPVGGGTGGATDTGIEVVTVGGNSDAGAFVLAAPVEVGALAYDLSLGDCTDQADQNWYLCNSGTVSSTGAVFEAMPGVILNGFARTETLQQRLGARITGMPTTVSSRGTGDALVNQSVGPWVRTWGDFTDITPDQSSAGVSWQSDSWGFEAGIGTMLGEPAGGDLIAGVTLRYGSTFAQLDSVNGTGSIEANGFGIGASLTWFGTNGFYVDANGAIDFVSIDATSQGGGTLLDGHDDEVYSASIEIGQRIALAGGATIVPQAQLSWGRMGSGQVTDELGNLVSFGDRETLTSRIGMTVEWDLAETELGAGQIYGFGNVLHDLSGSRTVTVAGTDVTQSGAGDWVELGGGFSLQPTETTNLFGQISYREAFDGVSGDAVAVSAGLRMQW